MATGTKLVAIPGRAIPVVEGGVRTGEKNAMMHQLETVLEATPHKSGTETAIAYGLRGKIDAYRPGQETIELEIPEVEFIRQGIEQLRAAGKLVGSLWYLLTSALDTARVKE